MEEPCWELLKRLLCKKLNLFNFLMIFSITLLTFLLTPHGASNIDLNVEPEALSGRPQSNCNLSPDYSKYLPSS